MVLPVRHVSCVLTVHSYADAFFFFFFFFFLPKVWVVSCRVAEF